MLNFLRNKSYVHKISSRKSRLCKFHNKIYLKLFVSIYHFYHIFGIIFKGIFYNLNITLNFWFISTMKTSISGGTLSENSPWVSGILSCNLKNRFLFFSVIATFKVTSCFFVLKRFSWSNSLVPLPFLLQHYIGQFNQIKIVKRWIVAKK